MLPKDIAKMVPKGKLMSETEWRSLGVQQSQGWVHYMVHTPEPHILLFRRPITDYEAAKKAQLLCKWRETQYFSVFFDGLPRVYESVLCAGESSH